MTLNAQRIRQIVRQMNSTLIINILVRYINISLKER